jgi:pimeloyl-ACP methyl ester carboxylesterase
MPLGRFVKGLKQTPTGLGRRLDEMMQALADYRRSGGKGPIYVVGHSRGVGVGYAFCERLNTEGLIAPRTGEQLEGPGVEVEGLVTLDPVPHTPGKGFALVPTGDRARPFKQVRYDEMTLPANVKRSIVILAGSERRDEFTPAYIGLGDERTSMVVIPHARHADVDDWTEGNRRAGALSRHVVSSLLGADHLRDTALSDPELRRLTQELAAHGVRSPILAERIVAALKGESARTFPPGVQTAESIVQKPVVESAGTRSLGSLLATPMSTPSPLNAFGERPPQTLGKEIPIGANPGFPPDEPPV